MADDNRPINPMRFAFREILLVVIGVFLNLLGIIYI